MNKILFSNYTSFEESSNIQIVCHQLQRENTVFRFRERSYECEHMTSGSYSNIIQDKNNPSNLKLYYRVCCDKRQNENHQFTCVAVSDDYGAYFHRPELSLYSTPDNHTTNNIILKDFFTNHNFSVFKDGNRLLGIGGTHNNNDKNSKEFEVVDYVWPEEKKNLFNPYINNTEHRNGLYLYQSADGYKWKLVQDIPIFHSLTDSLNEVKLGMVAFDTLPKVIRNYKTNKYLLYTRANVALDVRALIYSETEDFKNWTEPHFINIVPEFNYNEDNIYFSGAFNYPNSTAFIAFSPFFKTRQPGRITYYAATKIMWSNDGKNWITLNHIFERKERYKYDIAGFIEAENNKEFYIFFHENVYKSNNNIARYRIRKDGFTSVYSKNGFFVIKVPECNNYFINYRTEADGHIEIEFLDTNKNSIQEKIRLSGNEFNYKLKPQRQCIYIKIKIVNSHIYSISY